MDCNVFAGPLACKALPPDSSYLQQCPGVDARVDCIYWKHIQDNIYDSPVDNLEEYLQQAEDLPAKDLCPQCFDKVQRLWCSLASPRCGTFQTVTQAALLPSLSAVVAAYNKGQSLVEALSGAVTQVIGAMGLVLPCREMCEDMVATCGCTGAGGSNATFGSLLEWAATQTSSTPGQTTFGGLSLPAVFSRLLFKGVWDRSFCSLFQPSSMPGFTGKCTPAPASTCSDNAGWCSAIITRHSSAFLYIQGALVTQLAKAVTGWITDDSAGLWSTRDALTQSSDNADLSSLISQYASGVLPDSVTATPSRRPPPMGAGQIVGIVLLTLTGVAILAAGGFMAIRYVQAKKQENQYFELNSSENFLKPWTPVTETL